MAIFIELTTDIFDDNFNSSLKSKRSHGTGKLRVRRPTRGLELNEERHAYIKLKRADGRDIPLLDSGDRRGRTTENSNFILQTVTEQRMERHQIIETFGDTYLFLFGESPRFLQIQAMLIHSLDFNWRDEFMENYDKYLRGTKAIEKGARTYLFWDQNIVEGYILNCTTTTTAQDPHMVPLQFQFFVTNSQNISVIDDVSPDYPVRSSAIFPEGISPYEAWNGEELDLVLDNTLGPTESGFSNQLIQRENPIRSKIADNSDEFISGLQPTIIDLAKETSRQATEELNNTLPSKDLEEAGDELSDFNKAFADAMSSSGVDEEDAQSPGLANRLGIGPTFLPGGVGVGGFGGQAGAIATFGARASLSAGGFAGVKLSASAGASAFANITAGVNASAQAGAFAGANLGAGAFASGTFNAGSQAGFSAQTSSFRLGGGGVGVRASASAQASLGGFGTITSRTQSGISASAFASASASAKSSLLAKGYAQTSTRAAAQAGGYANANAALGFKGYSGFSGASFAGSYGGGASAVVKGKVSAFAFVSARGTLTGVGSTSTQLLSSQPKQYNWSASYRWP